jgi:histone H3/H4
MPSASSDHNADESRSDYRSASGGDDAAPANSRSASRSRRSPSASASAGGGGGGGGGEGERRKHKRKQKHPKKIPGKVRTIVTGRAPRGDGGGGSRRERQAATRKALKVEKRRRRILNAPTGKERKRLAAALRTFKHMSSEVTSTHAQHERCKKRPHGRTPGLKRAPFGRIVREICGDMRADTRITANALDALRQAAEEHLLRVFHKGILVMIAAGGCTFRPEHIRTAGIIASGGDPHEYAKSVYRMWSKTSRFLAPYSELARRRKQARVKELIDEDDAKAIAMVTA